MNEIERNVIFMIQEGNLCHMSFSIVEGIAA